MFKRIACLILILIGSTSLTSCYLAIVDGEGNIIAGGKPSDREQGDSYGAIDSDNDYSYSDNSIYEGYELDDSISEQPSKVVYKALTLYANAAQFKNYSNGGQWRTQLQVRKGFNIIETIYNSGLVVKVWYGEFRGWSKNNSSPFNFITSECVLTENLILTARIGNYWSTW